MAGRRRLREERRTRGTTITRRLMSYVCCCLCCWLPRCTGFRLGGLGLGRGVGPSLPCDRQQHGVPATAAGRGGMSFSRATCCEGHRGDWGRGKRTLEVRCRATPERRQAENVFNRRGATEQQQPQWRQPRRRRRRTGLQSVPTQQQSEGGDHRSRQSKEGEEGEEGGGGGEEMEESKAQSETGEKAPYSSTGGWYSPQTEGGSSLYDIINDGPRPWMQPLVPRAQREQESNEQRTAAKIRDAQEIEDKGVSDRRKLVDDWETYDEVWDTMREEAKLAAEREPLLVSFIYSTILNQKSLERAVAFHMANKLSSVNMRATQVQELFKECLNSDPSFRRSLRRDIIAVRERDPACTSYHDALLYFKGFQALQTHRVAHWLYKEGRHSIAYYLQSQVNQEFQIDIHPRVKFGEGVFIDHGTGIVIGETATIGNDVSMLHLVTLGGSGIEDKQRHPQIGNGVLIGAGACLLGNIAIGDGAQIGACSLVLEDVPSNCVAVGVPAKVLGKSKVKEPAKEMQQDFWTPEEAMGI